jgi:uncharacterized protein YdeI (YjbR/CyaY-like superfamily)
MQTENALLFTDGAEWRRWLDKHHDTENYVWLVHYKKGSSKSSISYREALEEAICFGWIDGLMKSIDDEKYILRYSPRKKKSVWSRLNKDRAEELIRLGKMTDAGLLKIEEAKRNGLWDTAYTNREKEELPEDLKDALIQDSAAWNNFKNFANSYRNAYIGWVNGAKTGVTRKRRIAEVVKRSSLNRKPGIQ